jgi:hypothetical protein
MRHKLLTVKIIAALGIPLFPLGAHFFLAANETSGFRETNRASRNGAETLADVRGSEAPGESAGETPPPIGPETLARVFRQPDKGPDRAPAAEKPPESNAAAKSAPLPGDGKFSYLGLIRESNDQEWLYIKEEETGRVISVNASLATADEERCVVEIEGISYFIRRN